MTDLANSPNTYRGRFAPSPTGPLHFGSLLSAVTSYLQAKVSNGVWLIRIEDIDPPREIPGSSDSILRTLEQHGLTWDESVLYQSQQSERYLATLETLQQHQLLYPCQCSRKTIAENQQRLGVSIYPGTCRNLSLKPNNNTSLRIICDDVEQQFQDLIQGTFKQNPARDVGDFILRRAGGLFAYQLAVVVDDEHQQITEIVRGNDLLDNTPRQIMLQRALGYNTPHYAHHPIATDQAGDKLSKQTFADAVNPKNAMTNIIEVLDFLEQKPPSRDEFSNIDDLWNWAITHWQITSVPAIPNKPINKK